VMTGLRTIPRSVPVVPDKNERGVTNYDKYEPDGYHHE
jgi:hypothetical protein